MELLLGLCKEVPAMRGIRSTIACVLLSMASVAAAGRVDAATIDTFDFTQGGYLAGGTLSGSFTGIVESSGRYAGYMEQSDLSSFSFSFVPNPAAGIELSGNSPVLFEFDVANFLSTGGNTGGNTSSLDFQSVFDPRATFTICVGEAAGLGYCGLPPTTGGPYVVNGSVGPSTTYDYTSEFPTITLVSSVTTTPLPPTWTMLIAGFVGLGFFAYRGTKKDAAAVVAA
jgi:hypothetical protein